jgi:hypothetical protein
MNSSGPEANMTIDIKKHRIRIHKDTVHGLGDPTAIQLLVDTKKLIFAIRAANAQTPREHTHMLYPGRIGADSSYEIYSRAFVEEFCILVDGLDHNCSYRMTGRLLRTKRAAVFSLETLHKIEGTQ